MRRKDKEITDRDEIEAIINQSQVCRLAMADGDHPYVVPLCFGYEDNKLYFHSANMGKKLNILRRNPNVCFEFDKDCNARAADSACDWGMQYKSVIGYGKVSFIESDTSRREALDIIMRQYGGKGESYPDTKIKNTVIFKVDIDKMTGKFSA